jgi:hypothetical protein
MKLTELFNDEQLILNAPMNEMANLYPMTTGLPVVIWFGEVGGQHGPRVKVSNVPGRFDASNCFVVSVAREPEVLTPKSVKIKVAKIEDVIDWIKINYEDLMELWKIHENGNGDSNEVLNRLQKI